MKGDLFFLVSVDAESAENYGLSSEKWKAILILARSIGWQPLGSILDYEFQFELELSEVEQPDQNALEFIETLVRRRCAKWNGVYDEPHYQLVTAEDALSLREALLLTETSPDFLEFLEKGAFRIAG